VADKYLKQDNDYGCGVFACINAFNNIKKKCLTYSHVSKMEKILKTCKDYGTHEKHMMKWLGGYFRVTSRKKFDKKFFNEWIAKDKQQAIVLYCYNRSNYEFHWANVFGKSDDVYDGVNFYIPNKINRWYYTKKCNVDILDKLMRLEPEETYIIYLREK
jgi:hypothetical protein